MNMFFSFIKKPLNIFLLTVLIGGIVWLVISLRGDSNLSFDTVQVRAGTVEREVNATGRIKTSDSVDLAFERSGKIAFVNAQIGQKVFPGQVLMRIDTSELKAQELRESANVQIAQAKLDQLLAGSRKEDLRISEIALENAQRTLSDIKNKESVDVINIGLNNAVSAMVTVTDIQYKYFVVELETSISDAKEAALFKIYGENNLGHVGSWYFLPLKGGLKQKTADLEDNVGEYDLELILEETKKALSLVSAALDAVTKGLNDNISSSDADKNGVSAAKNTILNSISAITAKQQAIRSAENAVKNAKAQLDLKSASATEFDIQMAEAQLTQARANLSLIQAQIGKSILYSPIRGIVARLEGKRGEIISPNIIAVSVIGNAKFDIEVTNGNAASDVYYLELSDVSWSLRTLNTPDATTGIFLEPSEKAKSVVYIKPNENVVEGTHYVELRIRSSETGEYTSELFIINIDARKIDYSVKVPAEVLEPTSIDPAKTNSVKVLIKNPYPVHLINVSVSANSKFLNKDIIVDIPPKSEKIIEFALNLDSTTPKQEDLVTILVMQNGRELAFTEKILSIKEYRLPYKQDVSVEKVFLGRLHKYIFTNTEGSQKTQDIMIQKMATPAFLITTPSAGTDIFDGKTYFIWKAVTLNPNESYSVIVKEDYKQYVITFLIAALVLILYFGFRSPIIIKKKAYAIHKKDTGNNEVKVVLYIKNRSFRTLEKVRVLDRLPGIHRVEEDFGPGTPEPRYRKHGMGEIILILGMKETVKIFITESSKSRTNYRPEIKNYFQLYFQKYA